MNEYPGEVNFFLQRFQKRPYEYLDSFHVLSDRFIGAHSIMVSAHERALLRERDVKVCHCPFSNCGKGVPETPALLEDGICVGLGTDGAAQIISMATKEGYRLMKEEGGVIAEGKKADFITINTMQSHLYPTGNLVNTLLECVTASDVCDMAVDGRLLMKDREVLTLDEEKILYEAMKYMEELEA